MQERNLVADVLAGLVSVAAIVFPLQVQAQSAQAQGEVVRIDATAGKITLRHKAISKLELPAMTMVYRVNPALLQGVVVGDQVQFTAQRIDGQYRVTALKK